MTSTNNKAKKNQESKPVIYDHIYPNIKDWPIYKLSKDRDAVVQEVTEHAFKALSAQFEDNIGRLIARTIYLEKIRTKQNPWKADPANELQYWRRVEREYGKIQPDDPIREELELSILKRLINRYTEEIVGSFDVRTFKFGRRFLTAFFSRLLNTARGRNIHRIFGSKHRLQSRIKVYGEVEKVRQLFPQGTVVVLPTHFSNLDSILIGYAIDAVVGLPPFSYGAGLNLYDSEIISYFMNRLGAYRVDRRKKNPIYLETLKSFSSISIQRGTNTIFFPGGTRSRDGSLESTLKLGLLNTLIQAQRGMLQQGSSQKIIVVPLILGYHFVLEAEQLINQHLKRSGEEKYIGERSKPIKMREFFKFVWKAFSESSEITMSLGEPMDVFGNKLDEEGRSLDNNGRPLDIAEYFMIDGRINRDKQRENVYTRQLAEKIVVSYHEENHVLTSHMVAFTGFQILRNEYPELDVFGIIRLPEEHYEFDLEQFKEKLELLQTRLISLETKGKVKMSPEAKSGIQEILDDALINLGVYHSRKPLKINKKGLLISESFKLLYYYNNRLDGYGLEDIIDGSAKLNTSNWSSIED